MGVFYYPNDLTCEEKFTQTRPLLFFFGAYSVICVTKFQAPDGFLVPSTMCPTSVSELRTPVLLRTPILKDFRMHLVVHVKAFGAYFGKGDVILTEVSDRNLLISDFKL